MNLQEFIDKYNGVSVDFDGAYGSQCVDLAKLWESENNYPLIRGNAIDEPNNIDTNFYEYIPNTPTGVPSQGDLVVWDYSPYGHIAIFISGDTNSFDSFDQNYPVGSTCHVQHHTYSHVKGWIHPKAKTPPTPSVEDELRGQVVDL